MNRVIVKAGRLIDGNGGPPAENATIVVEDGRIAAVHRVPVALPADGTELIDASHQTILPGLVDSHVHLVFSGGADAYADIMRENDQEVLLRAAANAQRALANGITTQRDCGGRQFLMVALRDAINGGLIAGPRLYVAGPPVTTTAGHLNFCGLEVEGVLEVRRAVRWLHKHQVDFVKVMVTGGYMTPRTNPLALQYSVEELTAIVEDAHRLGRRVAGHIATTPGIRAAVAAGLDTFEHCVWQDPARPGGTIYDPDTAAAMADRQVYVGLTIAAADRIRAARLRRGEQLTADERASFEQRAGLQHRMREQGVPLACHSDAGTHLCEFGEFAQSLAVLVRLYGWSPMDAIVASTKTAARAIGCADQLGVVEAGQQADLIFVGGDPIKEIEVLQSVDRVMHKGRTVARGGRLVL